MEWGIKMVKNGENQKSLTAILNNTGVFLPPLPLTTFVVNGEKKGGTACSVPFSSRIGKMRLRTVVPFSQNVVIIEQKYHVWK